MRVIAGQARGRKLHVAVGDVTRPTPDRVREALFSMLALDFTGLGVLDLFAGTGALGLEALSRGAQKAVFVEQHKRALDCLQKNLRGFFERAEILPTSVHKALIALHQKSHQFDLIFIDPPYALALGSETLERVDTLGLLREGGVVVCEHARAQPPPTIPPALHVVHTRLFGEVALTIVSADTRCSAPREHFSL